MRYLRNFNESIKLPNDVKKIISDIANDCLIDLIDDGYEFKFRANVLVINLGREFYDTQTFLYDDVKDHFLKFLEILSENVNIDYVFFTYHSNSFVYRTKFIDINSINPYNKYDIKKDELNRIMISFNI